MAEYRACSECGEDVTQDSDFCPHCGVLFTDEHLHCDVHEQEEATGVCVVCRRLVCARCGKKTHGRMTCEDHRKVEIVEDWARVAQSTEILDAELIRSLLVSNDFHVQVQNFNSIGYAWDGGGDSPVSRSNINKPAKVFVPLPEYMDAMRTIREWESSGSPTVNAG